MIVLVCGGREYGDWETLTRVLDALRERRAEAGDQITHVIHGDARGADHLAQRWAVMARIQPVRCPALWGDAGFGNKAGAIRNRAMLALKPDLVVAFPGGVGTAHMIKIAKAAHIPVDEV